MQVKLLEADVRMHLAPSSGGVSEVQLSRQSVLGDRVGDFIPLLHFLWRLTHWPIVWHRGFNTNGKVIYLDGNCWNVGCLSDIVYNHQLMKFINNSVSIVYTKLYWSHKKWIFLHDFTSMCRFDSVGNRHTGMLLSWQMSWHAEIHHTHNMCHSGRTTDISLTILLGDYDPQQVSFHHRYRPSLELPSLCMRYKLY